MTKISAHEYFLCNLQGIRDFIMTVDKHNYFIFNQIKALREHPGQTSSFNVYGSILNHFANYGLNNSGNDIFFFHQKFDYGMKEVLTVRLVSFYIYIMINFAKVSNPELTLKFTNCTWSLLSSIIDDRLSVDCAICC